MPKKEIDTDKLFFAVSANVFTHAKNEKGRTVPLNPTHATKLRRSFSELAIVARKLLKNSIDLKRKKVRQSGYRQSAGHEANHGTMHELTSNWQRTEGALAYIGKYSQTKITSYSQLERYLKSIVRLPMALFLVRYTENQDLTALDNFEVSPQYNDALAILTGIGTAATIIARDIREHGTFFEIRDDGVYSKSRPKNKQNSTRKRSSKRNKRKKKNEKVYDLSPEQRAYVLRLNDNQTHIDLSTVSAQGISIWSEVAQGFTARQNSKTTLVCPAPNALVKKAAEALFGEREVASVDVPELTYVKKNLPQATLNYVARQFGEIEKIEPKLNSADAKVRQVAEKKASRIIANMEKFLGV